MFSNIINKHKKLLETASLFPYSIELEDNKYLFIQYSRFNKPTKSLIIDEQGQVANQSIAKAVARKVLLYNSCMINSIKLDQMRAKELKLPSQMIGALSQIKEISFNDSYFKKNINAVIDAYQYHIDGQDILDQIGKEIDELDIEQVRKKSLLTETEALKAHELERQFAEVSYKQALSMYKTNDDRKYILEWIKKNKSSLSSEEQKIIEDAEELINYSLKSTVLLTLNNAVKNFENEVTNLKSNNIDDRVKEFIQMREIGYESNIERDSELLRNP